MADGRRSDPYACLPPTLVISLEEGPRRDEFRVVCGQHLSNGYEIIDAVDTRHLGNGHIGCALSHRRAIELAVERDWDEVLVLEDDAVPALNRAGALSVLSHVPRDAELVYLGGFRFRDYRREATEVDGLVRLRGGVTTTHALIYRRCVYTAVLDYIPPSVESVEESWGRGDPMRYGFAIDREYARWQADPERAIYALDREWAFIGNWSHAEPAPSPQKIRIRRDAGLAPTKMLVSRYHRFMTALLPGNASEELLRAVALAEPRAALRLARGASVREAMGNGADPEWWLVPSDAHRPRYADYCKFLVWQDPLDRLRGLYSSLAGETGGDSRWPGMVGDGLLRPPLLDEYFEPLVDAELALRASSVIDERVRPQNSTFRNVPVDVVVPLARLNDFLAERFGFQLPLAEPETSKSSRKTPRSNPLSPKMEATLSRLVDRHYESDFAMLNAGVPVYGGPVERRRPAFPGAGVSE